MGRGKGDGLTELIRVRVTKKFKERLNSAVEREREKSSKDLSEVMREVFARFVAESEEAAAAAAATKARKK